MLSHHAQVPLEISRFFTRPALASLCLDPFLLMSSKKSKHHVQNPEEGTISEPRFSKAHTDRRFAKIGKKDTTVHLDNRFKHIVKDTRFAIAGMSFLLQFGGKGHDCAQCCSRKFSTSKRILFLHSLVSLWSKILTLSLALCYTYRRLIKSLELLLELLWRPFNFASLAQLLLWILVLPLASLPNLLLEQWL